MAFKRGQFNTFGGKLEIEILGEDGNPVTVTTQVKFKRPPQAVVEDTGVFKEMKYSELLGEYLVSADVEDEAGVQLASRQAQLDAILAVPEIARGCVTLFFRGLFPQRESAQPA
ncbi:MAG TPA: hypothetical protein DIC36_01360 [Gammaproteobacteria bacterium]|nr:hypothetical protein [Gammaproteobacteria bacterium]